MNRRQERCLSAIKECNRVVDNCYLAQPWTNQGSLIEDFYGNKMLSLEERY